MADRVRKGARVAAAGMAALLLLAACSDDESKSPDTASATTVGDTASATTSVAPGDAGFTYGWIRPPAGLLRDLSLAQEAAIGLAIDDINAAGGVNGKPATLISVDQPLGGSSADAVDELVAQGADMILGPVGSTDALEALPALEANGMIACTASATSTELTAQDTQNVLYRTAMPDTFTVDVVADLITADAEAANLPEGQPYTVTVMARSDDYGVGVGNALASVLTARGMAVDVVTYNPRQVIFTQEAAQVAAASPDAVVLVSYAEVARLVDDLVSAGVPASSIIGLDGAFVPGLGQRAFADSPEQIDGMRVVGSTGGRAFVQRLADVPNMQQIIYGAQMYDCVTVGALAADAAGSASPADYGPQMAAVTQDGRSCSTYADCVAQLDAGDDIDYQGVSGGIAFDANGDPTEVRVTVAGFENGEMIEISTTDVDFADLRQQEAIAAAVFTSRVQQLLKALGYYDGPVDGQWNDATTAALKELQTALGVPATGVWDAATDAAVRARYGDVTGALSESVIGIQQMLTALGFYTGPIDGVYSQATVDAIKAFQAALGVPQTGIIDAATLKAAYEQGVTAGSGTPPTTTVPPATTVPPTAPPTTAAPGTTLPPAPDEPSMLEALRADPQFSTLVELLEAAGFTDDTEVLGPITLFAPTNDAFDTLTQEQLDALKSDPERLKQALAYHLVDAGLTLDDLKVIDEVRNVYGEMLTITVEDGVVTVNGVATVAPDIAVSNGVIIPVSGILLPPG